MTNVVKQVAGWYINSQSVNDYRNESQSVNIVPISKYSLNATMFHYVLAIRTESYKIREFMNSRHVASLAASLTQLIVSNASMNMWENS